MNTRTQNADLYAAFLDYTAPDSSKKTYFGVHLKKMLHPSVVVHLQDKPCLSYQADPVLGEDDIDQGG